MDAIRRSQPINLKVVRLELDFTSLVNDVKPIEKKPKKISVPKVNFRRKSDVPSPPPIKNIQNARDVKTLVKELLDELYADQRDWSCGSAINSHGSFSAASVTSSHSYFGDNSDAFEQSYLEILDIPELFDLRTEYEEKLQIVGEKLSRCVRTRDRLKRQQKRLCAAFTVLLRHITGDTTARFGISPALGNEGPGEGGFTEWLHAMRLVARLPAGVPQHFRRKLWLTLSERHITARGIDWPAAERACFRGTALPDDAELGAQILKDLHRTGCSLFCGTEARENQAMLRRVLLAYARWNKDVGYCQGFNMIAAIILEVMDKSESDSLKVMIYLVEAVLPEGYFADDLRGLSADMAAFRDLLRIRIPRLANHMDYLQKISDGGGVEPPLPDVFTMQWFLTLYATWLPRESLLRIWDLVLLDGNEVLLLTALAIWDMLQDRILSARSADEFYSCMGGGAGAVYAAGEALPARVVAFGAAPELPRLRSLHRYTVTPPAPNHPPMQSAMQSMTKRGLRLFYSEDEGDSSDDGNKMALATVAIPRREDRLGAGDRLTLDIGALKRQYVRLRERQRQAHVILAAACARHAAVGVPTSPTSLTVNNLLLGKSAIVSSRGRRLGPPPGAIPPSRQTLSPTDQPTSSKSETISWDEEHSRKSLSRRNSVKWKDIKKEKGDKCRKASIDLDEVGDGVIVSDHEANEMIASLRSRSSCESSSYSSHSGSSTDTSLCDDNEKASDSELDLPEDRKNTNISFDKLSSPKKLSLAVSRNETLPTLRKSPAKFSDIVKVRDVYEPKNTSDSYETKSIESISEYLDSVAGKPLRIYIDGFESKLSENTMISPKNNIERPNSPSRLLSPFALRNDSKMSSKREETYKSTESIKVRDKITDISPLDISPCDYDIGRNKHSPFDYNTIFRHHSTSKLEKSSRPNDIIDNLTRYPNFVPDLDLTGKSPCKSPGAESILVSEDEYPIPLTIDKYFEHSPEFFGARVTDPNNSEIPNRRAAKRYIRLLKKPDSLTLQSNHNDKISSIDAERASSLPQSHSFTVKTDSPSLFKPKESARREVKYEDDEGFPKTDCSILSESSEKSVVNIGTFSPKDYFIRSGRQNSERALQIIQENSKILSRILTKQHIKESSKIPSQCVDHKKQMEKETYYSKCDSPTSESKRIDSPQPLKESTSDSLIDSIKGSHKDENERNYYIKVRPISIDDPFSLEIRSDLINSEEKNKPSIERIGNKTDLYGWENKGFLVKYDNDSYEHENNLDHSFQRKDSWNNKESESLRNEYLQPTSSSETKTSEPKITPNIERHSAREGYNYPISSKYSDFVLSKASDICSQTVDQGPKICENILKTDNSQVSDFSHIVTSSISFTYDPSADDDSPVGAKSNSSDTLCQIASLDQVSTPISPKVFPNRDTPKDFLEKSDTIKTIVESDDTCSAITSLIETDTLSSLSYPRSPSTGSYHPFPTRPSLRMPKELGVKLGMYPKDSIRSPSKQFGES